MKKSQKNGQNHRKTGKNGQFYQNTRLNSHARFKTADFGTLPMRGPEKDNMKRGHPKERKKERQTDIMTL